MSHSVTAALRLYYLLYLCVSLLIFLHCCIFTASTLHERAAQDKEVLALRRNFYVLGRKKSSWSGAVLLEKVLNPR